MVDFKGKQADYHLNDKMTVVPGAPSTNEKIAMKTQTHELGQAMMNSLAVLKLSTVNAFIAIQSTRSTQSLKRPKICAIFLYAVKSCQSIFQLTYCPYTIYMKMPISSCLINSK